MNQLLFLSLLVCSVICASGSASFRSDMDEGLYELCPDDQFDYAGLKVNSFRKIHGNLSLFPIGTYALEEAVNYFRMFDESDADQLQEIRSHYHRRLIELYSRQYLNDPLYSLDNVMNRKIAALQANLTSFMGKGNDLFLSASILRVQRQKMEEARNLTVLLNIHKNERLVPEIIDLKHFDFYMHFMRTIGDRNSTMAFRKEDTAAIYSKRIYKFESFKPTRSSSLFYNWRKSSGDLLSSIYIPFEQRDSKFVIKTRACVHAKELPIFFRLKGKSVQ